jgi:hypothetical protein
VRLVLGRAEVVVEDGMRGFVQQDEETGRGFEVRIGGDDAALVVGVALTCPSQRELAQRPSLGFEPGGELVERAVWAVAGGQLVRVRGDRVAVGLGDVEHRQDRVADQAVLDLIAGVGVGLGDLLDGVAEDLDCLLAFADLTAQLLPGSIPGHVGGLRALCGNQQDVVERVAAKRCHEQQVGDPLGRAGQRSDLLPQRR